MSLKALQGLASSAEASDDRGPWLWWAQKILSPDGSPERGCWKSMGQPGPGNLQEAGKRQKVPSS